MDANAKFAGLARDDSDLLGLRFSAGLLVALGCLWCLYAVFFAVILGVEGVRAWRGQLHNPSNAHWFLTSFLLAVLMCALTWLCIRAARALREARRWGAYVAMAFGLLLLLFTGDFIYDMYHPERQSPDEGFGIFIVPFMLIVGLWWCVYLNLPHVRGQLSASTQKED